MTIDKYTKFLLTMIAVGIIGINFHLFKGSVVKDAFEASANDWQVEHGFIYANKGRDICSVDDRNLSTTRGKWQKTGC